MPSKEEDAPLGPLSRSLRSKSVKKTDRFKLSREGPPNPIHDTEKYQILWVFAEKMLQCVLSAKLFSTGPENLMENFQKFRCMICQIIVSLQSHRIHEIKRHYQSRVHLCQNQRYRERKFLHAVRGKDARVLYGTRFPDERKICMDFDVPEMGHKCVFITMLCKGSVSCLRAKKIARGIIQLQLSTTFLKMGGQLWVLICLWTPVGILIGNSASTSDFNWSLEQISLSFLFKILEGKPLSCRFVRVRSCRMGC